MRTHLGSLTTTGDGQRRRRGPHDRGQRRRLGRGRVRPRPGRGRARRPDRHPPARDAPRRPPAAGARRRRPPRKATVYLAPHLRRPVGRRGRHPGQDGRGRRRGRRGRSSATAPTVDLVNLDEHGADVTLLACRRRPRTATPPTGTCPSTSVAAPRGCAPRSTWSARARPCYPIGIYFADEGQHFDVQPYIRHIAPRATSDVLYKGALQGHSRARSSAATCSSSKDAVGTDTNETNRTLILTDGARADSTPFLEIFCSDIKASHGSATGQIDARHLFYLEARGIPRDQALRLIVLGFFREVLDRFDVPGVEDRAMAHIEREIDLADIDRIATTQAQPLRVRRAGLTPTARPRLSHRTPTMADLEIRDLTSHVQGKTILDGVTLDLDKGKTLALMGPNGSGKSTLAYAIAGHPAYEVTGGSDHLQGRGHHRLDARRARPRRRVPRDAVPGRGAGRVGHQLPAHGRQRPARGGPARPPVHAAAQGPDGRPAGRREVPAAVGQRGLLRRREEALRDPADGDAQARDRRPRRDRLRPGRRRAQDRVRGRQRLRGPDLGV